MRDVLFMRARFSERNAPAKKEVAADAAPSIRRPLVVDVDEVLVTHGAKAPQRRDQLRQPTTLSLNFESTHAQFNTDAVAQLLRVLGQGQPVYLCSEIYPEAFVKSAAEHLGVFTAWSADDSRLMGDIAHLPIGLRHGFEYLGNRADLPQTASRLPHSTAAAETTNSRISLRDWAKLLRVHQYAKNALVLVPLLTAHKFDLTSLITALLAVVAFSLAASSAYILNDLLDVQADRAHSTKRYRPIASGAISPTCAVCVSVIALLAGVTISSLISLEFCGVLIGYLILTCAYSFWLKRIAIVDVVTLAVLYTVRVFGGAIAIGVSMSEWLVAFSLFIFMSLALVKRHVELIGQPQAQVLAARDYRPADAPMIATLAAGAGFSAVVIFALYISSEAVRALYSHPQLLWMNCPILMYWIGRVMLLAQRGLIDDDPIIFALKDRASWLVFAAIGVLTLVAI